MNVRGIGLVSALVMASALSALVLASMEIWNLTSRKLQTLHAARLPMDIDRDLPQTIAGELAKFMLRITSPDGPPPERCNALYACGGAGACLSNVFERGGGVGGGIAVNNIPNLINKDFSSGYQLELLDDPALRQFEIDFPDAVAASSPFQSALNRCNNVSTIYTNNEAASNRIFGFQDVRGIYFCFQLKRPVNASIKPAEITFRGPVLVEAHLAFRNVDPDPVNGEGDYATCGEIAFQASIRPKIIWELTYTLQWPSSVPNKTFKRTRTIVVNDDAST